MDRYNIQRATNISRGIRSSIAHRSIERKEIEQKINDCIEYLNSQLQPLLDEYDKANTCLHGEYKKPTYTNRRCLLGDYYNKYEQVCANCGQTETALDMDLKEGKPLDLPDWTKGAGKLYYNNDF